MQPTWPSHYYAKAELATTITDNTQDLILMRRIVDAYNDTYESRSCIVIESRRRDDNPNVCVLTLKYDHFDRHMIYGQISASRRPIQLLGVDLFSFQCNFMIEPISPICYDVYMLIDDIIIERAKRCVLKSNDEHFLSHMR